MMLIFIGNKHSPYAPTDESCRIQVGVLLTIKKTAPSRVALIFTSRSAGTT